MLPLVRLYGAKAVNEAGIVALGYPGILALERYEIQAITKVLGELKDATKP
jgi:hypothetical protein